MTKCDMTWIGKYELSTRACNILRVNEVASPAHALALSVAGLMAFHGCGRRTAMEIIDALTDDGTVDWLSDKIPISSWHQILARAPTQVMLEELINRGALHTRIIYEESGT